MFVPSAGTSTLLLALGVRVSKCSHKPLRHRPRNGLNRAMHRHRVHHGPQGRLMEVLNQEAAPQKLIHRTSRTVYVLWPNFVSLDICSTLVAQLNAVLSVFIEDLNGDGGQ